MSTAQLQAIIDTAWEARTQINAINAPEVREAVHGNTAIIGFILLGMTCIAIGQFFSALTENQIVAALITIPTLLLFWFIGFLQTLQSSVLLRDLFAHLSFSLHYADFIHGLLRSEAIVYFIVVAGVALTLNTSYLQWRR